MFDRVTVTASDLVASRRFYEAVLEGVPDGLSLAAADADSPPTRHLHLAFAAFSRDEVEAFWRRGVDAGYPSDGDPGLRPQYDPNYYGAFLLDPDGNSVEACCGFRDEAGPPIDHLWIGVRDLEASRRFWEGLAPRLDLRVVDRERSRVQVVGRNRSFALVHDGRPPTEHLHLAFPATTAFRLSDPDGTVVEGVP
ncbi:MAG TPA: VOC family protein [Gaiellaceae bacterium]|nr:VOC family protein [Gaiellaceae bacterium]